MLKAFSGVESPVKHDTLANFAISRLARSPDADSAPVRVDDGMPSVIMGPADVLVAGALAVDYSCDYAPFSDQRNTPQMNTSNPARITQSLGGVAHNVAKAAHYLGADVKLLSLVGDDLDGRSARHRLEDEGMRVDGIEVCAGADARTARYVAINDAKKDLVMAMADMNLLNSHGESYIRDVWEPEMRQNGSLWFVADANWEPRILHNLFASASSAKCLTALEPVSVAKGSRLFKRLPRDTPGPKELTVFPENTIDLMTPNAMELAAMHTVARDEGLLEEQQWWKVIDELGIPSSGIRSRLVDVSSKKVVDQGIPQQAIQLLPFVPCIATKLGAEGVLLTMMLQKGDPRLHSQDAAPYIISRNSAPSEIGVAGVYMRLYPPVARLADDEIVSVNGVGDTFLGALIAAMQQTGKGIEELIDFAQEAALLSLQSAASVSPELRRKQMRKTTSVSATSPQFQMSGR